MGCDFVLISYDSKPCFFQVVQLTLHKGRQAKAPCRGQQFWGHCRWQFHQWPYSINDN